MRKIINILKRKRLYNEKENVLIRICILMVSTIVLGCFSASAATTTSSGSYILSKSDQTEKSIQNRFRFLVEVVQQSPHNIGKAVLSLHILIPLIPKLIAAAV